MSERNGLDEGPIPPIRHERLDAGEASELIDVITALRDAVIELRITAAAGKVADTEQKTGLLHVGDEVRTIRDQLSTPIAKEDLLFEIFRRAMTIGISVTGGLISVLLAVIGWLLTHGGT